MGFRVDSDARHGFEHFAGERVEVADAFDGVVKEFKAHRVPVGFGGHDVEHVALDAEGAAQKLGVIPRVLQLGEMREDVALVDGFAAREVQPHLPILAGVAKTVDAGDGSDDDGVAPLEDGLGGGEAHLLDVFVDGGVFFDEGVGGGDVGFRLVVVVVGDEVFHRVVREKFAHFAVKLRGEGLVRRENQRRTLRTRDDVRHGEGFAGAGNAEQGLLGKAVFKAFQQLLDGGGLVAGGLVIADELEKVAHGES